MYTDYATNSIASGYQANAMSGLSDEQRLLKGIHGVAVYLKRATMVEGPSIPDKTARTKHLSDADRLLAFLEGIVKPGQEFGLILTQCYQGIRRLILGALIAEADPRELVMGAYEQARELETVIKWRLTNHDQPT